MILRKNMNIEDDDYVLIEEMNTFPKISTFRKLKYSCWISLYQIKWKG